MKTRFSTLDIVALLPELNEKCKGLRVTNAYNINNKTYLLKLSKNTGDFKEEEEDLNKNVLLIESGLRIHLTEYDWPKEPHPNGFTMKIRKHIKNKRIESIKQLGYDRIIDIQFGSNEAAYHIILELYDRGNILITDCNYLILNLLRPRKDGENEDVKFLVKEIYPVHHYQNVKAEILKRNEIQEIIEKAKIGDNLKKLISPKLLYGPALLEHCFIEIGLGENCKLDENKSIDIEKIYKSIELAHSILLNIVNQRGGYIVQKEEDNLLDKDGEKTKIISFLEFNPIMFNQYKNLEKKKQSLVKYDSFDRAIDVFFSSIESQKIDQRIYQKKKDVMKKLDNIKKDHEKRLQNLEEQQKIDDRKGYLIQINNDLVEKALFILRSALARQMSWSDIKQMLKEAQDAGDEVASKICSLKFDINAFTILLDDPYEQQQKETNSTTNMSAKANQLKVDISLELSAHANARKYFEERKFAKKKEDKTIEASSKALKNAQVKTAQAIKEVHLKSSIVKSRKVLWFEKFFWFISSENYIVIGGRDAQQNELIVKRYLRPGDLYVHADLHGASSVVIKNRNSGKIPGKTIEEAGVMAICYSTAWEQKTPVKAWWVNSDQVTKTAPSGEYLTVGSFMIRGKKNYLPQVQLVMGFSFFFRLEEESIANHVNDRKVKYVELEDKRTDEPSQNELNQNEEDDVTSAFPDTKIRTPGKIERDQDMILEAMKPRSKIQRKLKIAKQEKKIEQQEKDKMNKQQSTKQSNQQKNKKTKGKNKKNKKDDWSDDEDKITIKLNKKLQKDTRLQDLEGQTRSMNLNDDELEEEISDKDEMENELIDDTMNNDELIDAIDDKSNQQSNEINDDQILEPQLQQQDNESSDSEDEKVQYDEEEEEEEVEDEETSDERREIEYLKLVNSLTGQPLANDVLMYCVPVVAPYNSVVNCKFKVKVLPGTNKRGRSAKTALQLFLTDKKITPRERDLLKSVKDLDIARNLPPKIKVTAQHLQQVKRKK